MLEMLQEHIDQFLAAKTPQEWSAVLADCLAVQIKRYRAAGIEPPENWLPPDERPKPKPIDPRLTLAAALARHFADEPIIIQR